MSLQYDTKKPRPLTEQEESQRWAQAMETFLAPYTERLDAYLDRRLVGNLTGMVGGLIQRRTQVTLTEVGSGLLGAEHASAGIRRVDRLLHHAGWDASMLEQVRWEQAEQTVKAMIARGERPLLIMDSSEWEKPESKSIVGNSAVISADAKRLTQYRKHIYNRITIPIRVPGYEWEALILLGAEGIPQLVAMRWWQREKGVSGQQRRHQIALLEEARWRFGQQVTYVFDRGYGHGPWLSVMAIVGARFVMRWKKGNKLHDAQGNERKAWEIARPRKGWSEPKQLWDRYHRCFRSARVQAFQVKHPDYPRPLWLVVVRLGTGVQSWYLLTNRPVLTFEDAWSIVFEYTSRWKIEEVFRVEKCEFQIESIRVQDWETQRCLLEIVTLACGVLFSFLRPPLLRERERLLGRWCPRSDWRLAQAKLPLYRLRWALSELWTHYPPRWTACHPYRSPTHITWPPGSVVWWMTCWHRLALPLSYEN